jgi:hypothetical protein
MCLIRLNTHTLARFMHSYTQVGQNAAAIMGGYDDQTAT